MIKTFRQLLELVPPSWRDADIAIDSGIGNPEKLMRVSLHKMGDGRQIILLHEKAIETWAVGKHKEALSSFVKTTEDK